MLLKRRHFRSLSKTNAHCGLLILAASLSFADLEQCTFSRSSHVFLTLPATVLASLVLQKICENILQSDCEKRRRFGVLSWSLALGKCQLRDEQILAVSPLEFPVCSRMSRSLHGPGPRAQGSSRESLAGLLGARGCPPEEPDSFTDQRGPVPAGRGHQCGCGP